MATNPSRVALVALVAVIAVTHVASAALPPAPLPPLTNIGRWFVDAAGRVVLFHGVNEVNKVPPFYSAARGFGDDDAAFLVAEGFNAVRLGVDFRGLMPIPGQVEETYIDHLAESVTMLGQHGIFVLLDFHQDGFAPMFNGNGLPDWMAITDGLPNPPDAVFPLYYVQNPAMQRAFEHFWDDSPGPGGVSLQTYFLQGVERVVTRFAGDPMVLGTELMNEPWPGADWTPCVLAGVGCPELEQARLMPFYRRGAAVARAVAPTQYVFVEPFVLFNFGQGPTSIPGTDPGFALSFHSYALSTDGEEAVAQYGAAAASRDAAPVIVTEFGAVTDPVVLSRLAREFDDNLLPWMFWSYQSEIIQDESIPPAGDNVTSAAALAALVRPYPIATAGTPTAIVFDPATRVFDFAYTTERPDGGHYDRRVDTVVYVPPRHYPDGYLVKAHGAKVISRRCAARLILRTRHRGQPVSVHLTPRPPAPVDHPFCR